jgi:UDP-MurNAc hydroxylase
MKVTSLGHAGLFIETRYGSILCDPWFNPAYFASWFPFPSNEDIDTELFCHPDYLYLSHLHKDHFDPRYLQDNVSKETIVLLPDFPLGLMERELRGLGFERFVQTKNFETVDLDGLRVTISSLVAPTDGPLGDSGLILDDGETRIFNQNDSRPVDVDTLVKFGPYDAHFLQFSGAIWFPMVYDMPEVAKQALGRKKRANQMSRALSYARQVGANYIFPSAGPPCFLDDDLWYFNDFDRDESNIFPDQTVFLEFMREHGAENGHLTIPGSVTEFEGGECRVDHPVGDDEVRAIFEDKRTYLEDYKARQQPVIDGIKAGWTSGEVEILPALKDWFEPLLEQADMNCVGVNGRVLLDCEREKVVLDFQKREVYEANGQASNGDEAFDYRFRIDPALVEHQILNHEEDWINGLFLSCRFEAKRKGAYNEYVYNFFKVLSPERLAYSEEYYAQSAPVRQLWECGNFMVQRSCPHLKADLTRFGEEKDGILTCMMHGWQFDLATGRCLTSDDVRIYATPLNAPVQEETTSSTSQH